MRRGAEAWLIAAVAASEVAPDPPMGKAHPGWLDQLAERQEDQTQAEFRHLRPEGLLWTYAMLSGEDRWGEWGESMLAELATRGESRDARGYVEELWREETDPDRKWKFLTALRRLQKKRDPLELRILKGRRRYDFPEQPVLQVEIANVEPEPVSMMSGGNYRSGRDEGFFVEIRDERGRRLANRRQISEWGGGLGGTLTLAPGETARVRVDTSRYVLINRPGEYSLRLHYVPGGELGGGDGSRLGGRIAVRSEVFRFSIRPRVVEAGAQKIDEARRLLAELDASRGIRMTEGMVGGEELEGFISPDSQEGRILALGYAAVPQMIAELRQRGLDPRKRAWILAMLFSVTGRNDPRGRMWAEADVQDALGRFECLEPSGSVEVPSRGGGCGGFFPGGASRGGSGRIDPEQQEKLARRWIDWREYLRVDHRE
jgi:hypothetical protein